MSSVIPILGEISYKTVAQVKCSLKSVLANPSVDKQIILSINSEGGDLESLRRIKTFMYFMNRYKGYKVIGRLIYGESAAFFLFLNCKERQVTDESIGIIHLPVLNSPGKIGQLIDERYDQVSFIVRRSNNKVTRNQVIELEGKKLNKNDLIHYGFANKKIETFTLS